MKTIAALIATALLAGAANGAVVVARPVIIARPAAAPRPAIAPKQAVKPTTTPATPGVFIPPSKPACTEERRKQNDC